jgi:multiple sugar transport system substrate-binding protein
VGDAIALFVRKDLFEAPEERSAFRKKHGFPLPRSFEDWEKLDMADFEKIAGFFTRPERGMWGTSMQYNEEHDFISMSLYPFMFSMGGKIWEPSERRVSGVLDSEVNAEAMARHRRMLACQPPMSVNFTTQQTIFYFYNMMSVATAFQWVEHGVYMVGRELEGKVDVVPPPSFRRRDGARRRVYPCGGQPWVINSRNDPDHMRVAVDYLRWWYLPETQAEYAKRGGIPVDRTTLSNPGFDGMHPWHRAYKYMHTGERTDDFWHDPCYVDLLAAQQAGFHSYASGEENDAGRVLERIACMQQKILFDAGRSTVSPPPECGVGESGR